MRGIILNTRVVDLDEGWQRRYESQGVLHKRPYMPTRGSISNTRVLQALILGIPPLVGKFAPLCSTPSDSYGLSQVLILSIQPIVRPIPTLV